MTFQPHQIVRHKPTGKLLIVHNSYPARGIYPAGYSCSPLTDRYVRGGYPEADIEAAPPRKPGGFDWDTEIVPRAQGALPWESMERLNLASTVSTISCCAGLVAYPHIAHVRKPKEDHGSWARLFLKVTQGGEYSGEAYALVYEGVPHRPAQALREAVLTAAVRAVHDKHAPAGDLAAAVLAMEAAPYGEPAMPSAWLLKICKHEVEDRSTREGRMRGWHPAKCLKCGVDLSVDSSD